MKRWLTLGAALLASLPALSAETAETDQYAEKLLLENWNGNARANIRMTTPEQAPHVDGRIEPGEWNQSLQFSGFSRNGKGLLPGQRGNVFLTSDGQFLYFAVRTTTPTDDPGGSLSAEITDRDGDVWRDDSVELAIRPGNEPGVARHIIINSRGAVYDRKFTDSGSVSEPAWNVEGMELANRVESGYWELEGRIPLSGLGITGSNFKLNVARNWTAAGATALIPVNQHLDGSRMIELNLLRRTPVIRHTSNGLPDEGKWAVEYTVENPTPTPYRFAMMIRRYETKTLDGKKQRIMKIEAMRSWNIAPGATQTCRLEFEGADKVEYWFSAVLFDPQNKACLFRRLFTGRKEVFAGKHPATAAFHVKELGSGVCWYYPSYHKATVSVRIPKESGIRELALHFDGRPVPAKRLRDTFEVRCPVPSAPGVYPLRAEAGYADGTTRRFESLLQLTKRTFPWENNRLGEEKIILPPFTALKAEGDRVSVLAREHQLGANGLFRSLIAGGRELLQQPMYWRASVDGRELRLDGAPPVFHSEDAGYSAAGGAEARSPEGFALKSDMRWEYDGFFFSDVTLRGVEGKTVDALTLVIPLKAAETPFFHAVGDTIRTNPAGRIPGGTGVVWDGSRLIRHPASRLHPQLVPYLWLGGVTRGLSFFVDSSMGFRLDRRNPALRLVRDGDTIRAEIDIVNRPVKLREGHRFSFGLQATPVKPLDRETRRMIYDVAGVGIPGMRTVHYVNWSVCGFPIQWSKEPAGGDYTLFRAAAATSRNGAPGATLVPEWDRFFAAHDPEITERIADTPKHNENDGVDLYRQIRNNFRILNFGQTRGPALPYKYSDPRLIFSSDDTSRYFQSEWWIDNTYYFGGWRSFPVRSNLDYMVWCYDRELRNGMHGIYLDDLYLFPNANPDTEARLDDEGELHARIGILGIRELIRRIAVMQHQAGLYPRVLQVHMTNAQLVPCFSFATSQLGWESTFGETPVPTRFSADSALVDGLGLRLGMDSLALGGILRKTTPQKLWPAKKRLLTRSFLSLALPHEIKAWNRKSPDDIDWDTIAAVYAKMTAFGFLADDCEFLPCWENPAATATAPGLLISAYRRPGKTLLVIGNPAAAVETALTADLKRLNLRPPLAAVDLESGNTVDLNRLAIPEYDFRLIELTGQR